MHVNESYSGMDLDKMKGDCFDSYLTFLDLALDVEINFISSSISLCMNDHQMCVREGLEKKMFQIYNFDHMIDDRFKNSFKRKSNRECTSKINTELLSVKDMIMVNRAENRKLYVEIKSNGQDSSSKTSSISDDKEYGKDIIEIQFS